MPCGTCKDSTHHSWCPCHRLRQWQWILTAIVGYWVSKIWFLMWHAYIVVAKLGVWVIHAAMVFLTRLVYMPVSKKCFIWSNIMLLWWIIYPSPWVGDSGVSWRMGFVGTLRFSLSTNYDFTKEYHLYKGTNNTHVHYIVSNLARPTLSEWINFVWFFTFWVIFLASKKVQFYHQWS